MNNSFFDNVKKNFNFRKKRIIIGHNPKKIIKINKMLGGSARINKNNIKNFFSIGYLTVVGSNKSVKVPTKFTRVTRKVLLPKSNKNKSSRYSKRDSEYSIVRIIDFKINIKKSSHISKKYGFAIPVINKFVKVKCLKNIYSHRIFDYDKSKFK